MNRAAVVRRSVKPQLLRRADEQQRGFRSASGDAGMVRAVARRRAFVALLSAVVLSAAGCARSDGKAVQVAKPVVVRLAPVVYSDAAVPVRANGVLSRKTEADLSFKIGGVVEAVLVRAGDAVKQGQVLARLRLDEIEAQVAQARSAQEKTRRDVERVEKLFASGAVAAENLQDARTALEQATAQVRIAEFNRRFAVITAPSTGRILRRVAEPDELVAAGRPVLGFASDADGWIVRAGLAEREVARVRLGDRAEVTGACAEPTAWIGRITQIAEAVEPTTRTTQVEIALEAPPCAARSGFVAAVTIFPRPVEARPVVPATALIEGTAGSASVFVVEAGSVANRRGVEVEALFETQAFLKTALPRAAQIVASGAEFLRDGSAVEAAK